MGAAEEEPLWNQFWNSTLTSMEASSHLDSESNVSEPFQRSMASAGAAGGGAPGGHPRGMREGSHPRVGAGSSAEPMIHPTDSVSQVSDEYHTPTPRTVKSPIDDSFVFKFRDVGHSGAVFRLTARSHSLSALIDQVQRKLGAGYGREVHKVSYVDDEGDLVNMSSDADLVEAVNMARRLQWPRLMLLINDQLPGQSAGPMGSAGAGPGPGAGATPTASLHGSQIGSPRSHQSPLPPPMNMSRGMRSPTQPRHVQPRDARDPRDHHHMHPMDHDYRDDPYRRPSSRPGSRHSSHSRHREPEPFTASDSMEDSDYYQPRRRHRQRRPNSGFFERAADALSSDDPMANMAIFVGSGATVGIAIALTYLVYSRTR